LICRLATYITHFQHFGLVRWTQSLAISYYPHACCFRCLSNASIM
jgi:hypothetical protein